MISTHGGKPHFHNAVPFRRLLTHGNPQDVTSRQQEETFLSQGHTGSACDCYSLKRTKSRARERVLFTLPYKATRLLATNIILNLGQLTRTTPQLETLQSSFANDLTDSRFNDHQSVYITVFNGTKS
ncbi:hypothetical protein TNCV_4260511 [Trichonephila clavipes]|nr:hypothetical protein TNCV_4260511 [Trichonephila clavipes]